MLKLSFIRALFAALAFVFFLLSSVSIGTLQSKSADESVSLVPLITWTNFQAATRVLGQTDFVTATSGAGNNKFNAPFDVAVDPASGKVFVVEFSNRRILRFTSVAAATNGGAAEAVLGQPDFTTTSFGTTQSKLSGPQAITIDSAGRLWVGDSGNNRVLRFDNAAAKANGANADGVLGEPNFTTSTGATTQNGMQGPSGVTVDSAGRLYVAGGNEFRVLIFDNAAALANGANASNVLGQPNFTSSTINNGGISAASLASLGRIFFDEASQNLFVPDTGNNRVLHFGLAPNAASVSIGGRIIMPGGMGLKGAVVLLNDTQGNLRQALSSSFGYYRFDDIGVVQTVVIQVVSKRYSFAPQVINVTEDVEDLNFTAQ